ncbi:MAG TPA: hypothetical protein VHX49_15780 [Candidatus Acidoferrales bacterium]|nr:hypothetical protein [Candidatus Acidoferrales bacterium]
MPVHANFAAGQELSLRTGVEGFFRQKRLFVFVVFAVVFATVVAIVAMRKQYLSEMALLVQNTRENVVVSAERTTTPNVSSDVTEDQVNSQVEILRSHDVIDPVADPGWANLTADKRTPEAIDQHEKLIAKFEKKLDTEIVRKTDVVDVSYLADSPEHAQDALERLSASYLAELRRLQRPVGASEFFASEAQRTLQEWNAATGALVAFQQEHQVVSVPTREMTLQTQVAEDDEDLFSTDAALRELDAQLQASAKQIVAMPSREVSEEKSSANQGLMEELSTLLVQMENKRTDLTTNYKSSDRQVQDLDEQIKTTQAALSVAQTSPSKEQTTDIDPAWQQVHTNYVQNQIARHATEEHKAAVTGRIAALNRELSDLESTTAQFNQLQAQADHLKEDYDLYAQKRDQAQIEDAMDEHKLLNVAVAEQPTLSFQAERPKPLLYGALGFVSAMFLGLCAVYFAETSRRTVATPRELDTVSRYPVLATVPHMFWRPGSRRQAEALALETGPPEIAPAASEQRATS